MEEILTNLKNAIQGWLEVANSAYSVESNTQIVEIAVLTMNAASKVTARQLWIRLGLFP